MTEPHPGPPTFFGVSRALNREEREGVVRFLSDAWRAQTGQAPGSLIADLERLSGIFGAEATPKRLRDSIARLKATRRPPATITKRLFVSIDDKRGFVTPEGRVALEQFRVLDDGGRDFISTAEVAVAADAVASTYSDWRLAWIEKHVAGAGLRPGSFGWVLFLLINGSVSRDTALRLPSDESQERQLAAVVMPVIDAFAEGLGVDSQSGREGSRLRSNWRVTQARALLFEFVCRADDKPSEDAFYWVQPEAETILAIGERLAARRTLDLPSLSTSLDALVVAYEGARPALSAFGAANDRRAHTKHVLDEVKRVFVLARSSE